MISFSLPLADELTRPTIDICSLQAVIDTGSSLPILDLDDDVILSLFGGKPLDYNKDIKGIGSSPGRLFILDHFSFGKISFRNIIAFQSKINDDDADILLGATMYGAGTKVTIDSGNNIVHFEYPDDIAKSHSLWSKNPNGIWRMIDYRNGHFVYL